MSTREEGFKRRLFEIIEASKEKDIASRSYDMMMFVAVVVGLIPLTIKGNNRYTILIDIVTVLVFIFDYIARIYTSDYKMGYKSYKSYLAYIVTPMAIIDLLAIIPGLSLFFPNSTVIGLFRIFRVLMVLKLTRYSKTMTTIGNVLRKVKGQLLAVLALVIVYIVAVALIMFTIEPDLFPKFTDAFYWASVSITTIGYGDIAPTTTIGRFITAVSALVGVAVVALPTGIITAAFTDELKRKKSKLEL